MKDDYLTWFKMLEAGVSDEEINNFLSPKTIQEKSLNHETPILKPSGPGILGCLTRFSDIKGHYDATQEVLQELGLFGNTTINSIAMASRLPDLIHFKDDRYHATSTVDHDGIPIDPENDAEKFKELFFNNIRIANESIYEQRELSKNNIISFYYHLGIAFHMIQDLATHQGMSSREHSYLDKHKKSPDASRKRYELAKLASFWMLDTFVTKEIKKKSNQLDLPDIVEWKEFQTVKSFLRLATDGFTYKISPLSKRTEAHIARWFSWVEWEPLDKAMNRIKSILIEQSVVR